MMFYRPQPQPDVDGTDGLVELVAPQQPDLVTLFGTAATDPQQLEPVCADVTDGALLDCVATSPLEILHAEMSPTIAKQDKRMSTICLVRYLI